MSTPDNGSNGRPGVKTLAIRLEPDLHAQLSLIAQLRGSTITDEIREAITAHLKAVKAAPDLAGQADNVLAAIEAEATTRRQAITALFGDQPSGPPGVTRARRGKPAADADSSAS